MTQDERTEYKMGLIIPNEVSIKDMGKIYKKLTIGETVDLRRTYLPLLSDFMAFLFRLVLEGHTVRLPFKCGTIRIIGKLVSMEGIEDSLSHRPDGTRRYTIDWGKTDKLQHRGKTPEDWKKWKREGIKRTLVYQMNHETNGIRYKIVWNKFGEKIKNSMIYKFIASRDNKSLIAFEIVNNKREYILVNPRQNVQSNPLSYDVMNYFYE